MFCVFRYILRVLYRIGKSLPHPYDNIDFHWLPNGSHPSGHSCAVSFVLNQSCVPWNAPHRGQKTSPFILFWGPCVWADTSLIIADIAIYLIIKKCLTLRVLVLTGFAELLICSNHVPASFTRREAVSCCMFWGSSVHSKTILSLFFLRSKYSIILFT